MEDMIVETRDRFDISALAGQAISTVRDRMAGRMLEREAAATETLATAVCASGCAPAALLRQMRRLHLTDAALLDTCIPDAARRLGTEWVEDGLSFAAVSIGAARLQTLTATIAPPPAFDLTHDARGTAALFVLPEYETHTLGAHVAAAQMRRRGVSVRLLYAPSAPQFAAALSRDPYDLVLFSCATTRRLAFVSQLVSVLRTAGGASVLSVLGGAVLDLRDGLETITGVDLVTNDVRAALLQQEAHRAGNAMAR